MLFDLFNFLFNFEPDYQYAIFGLVGSLVNSGVNAASQNATNNSNIFMSREKMLYDTAMWNKQNEYNSPTQQIQRLREAGLNPNLVYGNGSVVGNTTSNAPQMQTPDIKAPRVDIDTKFSSLQNMIGTYNDTKVKQAQTSNIESQIAEAKARIGLLNVQTINEGKRTGLIGAETASKLFSLDLAKSMMPYQLQGMQLSNDQREFDLNKSRAFYPTDKATNEQRLRNLKLDNTLGNQTLQNSIMNHFLSLQKYEQSLDLFPYLFEQQKMKNSVYKRTTFRNALHGFSDNSIYSLPLDLYNNIMDFINPPKF